MGSLDFGPDETLQRLMDVGRERNGIADYEMAETLFDKLIGYWPHDGEGWNPRGSSIICDRTTGTRSKTSQPHRNLNRATSVPSRSGQNSHQQGTL